MSHLYVFPDNLQCNLFIKVYNHELFPYYEYFKCYRFYFHYAYAYLYCAKSILSFIFIDSSSDTKIYVACYICLSILFFIL